MTLPRRDEELAVLLRVQKAESDCRLSDAVDSLRALVRTSGFDLDELACAYVRTGVARGYVRRSDAELAYARRPDMPALDDVPLDVPDRLREHRSRLDAWVKSAPSDSVGNGREEHALSFLLKHGKVQQAALEELGVGLTTDIGVVEAMFLSEYRDAIGLLCDAFAAPPAVLERVAFLVKAVTYEHTRRSSWEVALETAIMFASDPKLSPAEQAQKILAQVKAGTSDPSTPAALLEPTHAQLDGARDFMRTLQLRGRKSNPKSSKRGPKLTARAAAAGFMRCFGVERQEARESRVKKRKTK